MNMRMGTLVGLVAAVALAAGCGSMSATGTNGGGGSANTTVQSANSSKLGTSVLVNDKGMTLYTLSAERAAASSAPRARRSRAAAPRACRCGTR